MRNAFSYIVIFPPKNRAGKCPLSAAVGARAGDNTALLLFNKRGIKTNSHQIQSLSPESYYSHCSQTSIGVE